MEVINALVSAWTWLTQLDGFIPNVIFGGLFTGLVVGFILRWSQSRAESRQRKLEFEIAWESLRSTIHLDLKRTQVLELSNLTAPIPIFEDINLQIQDKPLGVWSKSLSSTALSNLIAFKSTSQSLKAEGADLDIKIAQEVRLLNAKKPTNLDIPAIVFARGIIYNISDAETLRNLDSNVNALPIEVVEDIRNTAEHAVRSDDVPLRIEKYQISLNKLRDAAMKLERSITKELKAETANAKKT